MLHATLAAVAILGVGSAPTGLQEPMAAPAELKQIEFMNGSWTVDLEAYNEGASMGKVTGSATTGPAMNGMYLETRHEADMMGMNFKGLQLTSYDPEAKEYVAWWFDSVAPGVLELRGALKDKTLTLVSKPVSFPGMPVKTAYRVTQGQTSPTKLSFLMETNPGTGWTKMMEGTMSKK